MWRALQGVLALVLAAGALGAAAPGPHPDKHESGDGEKRLDEMKVNLALLSDPVTFPYYLCARAEGGTLEVGGCVPDEAVRRRAIELARRNCARSVVDHLVIQADLSRRPPLRVEIMRKEGAELLARELGEAGRQIHIEAQPDGMVTVIGPIGSVEEKLAVSRLFRQVPGCIGVVNQLSVHPVMRDGRSVVLVTRDGSQTVPLAALGGEAEHVVAVPERSPWKAVPPAAAPSPPRAPRGVETCKEELPAKLCAARTEAPAPKPVAAEAPSRVRQPQRVDALAVPKPPSSWGEPDLRWEPVAEAPSAGKPSTRTAPAAEKERTAVHSPEAPTMVNSPLRVSQRWHDYGPATEGPKASAATPPALPPPPRKTSDSSSALPPLRSERAWPSAFAARPREPANGRPGVIIFDEPAPSPMPAAHHTPARPGRPAALVDLVRKVNAVCGKQAHDVLVEVQRDGSLLVKIKAAASVEKQLMSKILTIPEMASPNVHLAVEVIQ